MVYVKWVINTKCQDLLYCVDGAAKGAEFIHKELTYIQHRLLTFNYIWIKLTAEPLATIIIS